MNRSPIQSVAVLFDDYLIGGRETFVSGLVEEVHKNARVDFSLIARTIRPSRFTDVFDSKIEMGRGPECADNKRFASYLSGSRPNLIWAHHSEFLLGLILANRMAIPLLPTFHSPFRTGMVWNDFKLLLGTALVINRCRILSGVSTEILHCLASLGADPTKMRLLPNRVRITPVPPLPTGKEIRLALLCRSQKTLHIKAALDFFREFRRIFPGAKLVAHIAGTPGDWSQGKTKLEIVSRLYGRRWLLKNLGVLRDLAHITFQPPTDDVRSVVENAHVVLGMGRVVLEAMATGRIAVLIGYGNVLGVVTSGNFRYLRATNFSGRDARPRCIQSVVHEVADLVRSRKSITTEILSELDVSRHWKAVTDLFAECRHESLTGVGLDKFDNLDTIFQDNAYPSMDQLRSIATENEIEMFAKLRNIATAPFVR